MWPTQWMRQFQALCEKNVVVMKRNTWKVLICVIIPSLVVFSLYLGNTNQVSTSSNAANELPSPLQDLGDCDAFYTRHCLQIAYAPKTTWTTEVMRNVASLNNIEQMDDKMQGFETPLSLQVSSQSCPFLFVVSFTIAPCNMSPVFCIFLSQSILMVE